MTAAEARGRAARRPVAAGAAAPSPSALAAIWPRPAKRARKRGEIHRHDDDLLVRRLGECVERGDIFLGDQEVDRDHVARGGRLADETRRVRLGLGGALERLRGAEGGVAGRPSASSTSAALRPSARVMSDWRMPSASRITARFSRSAFICRPIASTRSFGGSMSLISMRVTLMPHGSRGGVDHRQEARIDLVAMRQQLIEVHRPHDGADVGHHQIEQRLLRGWRSRRMRAARRAPDRRRRRRPAPSRCPW